MEQEVQTNPEVVTESNNNEEVVNEEAKVETPKAESKNEAAMLKRLLEKKEKEIEELKNQTSSFSTDAQDTLRLEMKGVEDPEVQSKLKNLAKLEGTTVLQALNSEIGQAIVTKAKRARQTVNAMPVDGAPASSPSKDVNYYLKKADKGESLQDLFNTDRAMWRKVRDQLAKRK
jgi:hypothetical protein